MTKLLLLAAAIGAMALPNAGASSGGGWKHVTVVRQRGEIEATLSYETQAVDERYRRMTLVVRRAGTVVVDWLFQAGYQHGVVLTLRNVWGGSDPEALVQILSGGQGPFGPEIGVALVGGHGGGRVVFQELGGGGLSGEWHHGTFDFVSYDTRFFCAFSDCASSSSGPIQIFAIDAAGTRFVDVTRTRPDLIAADAAEQWRSYRREIVHKEYRRPNGRGSYNPLGVLVPWCGDEYLLGRKGRCDRALAQAFAKGYLHGPRGGRPFATYLQRTLAAWGYGEG